MKYLGKWGDSEIVGRRLTYEGSAKDRSEIRDLLKREQRGFCAYSEKHLSAIDQVEVDHFDDELKGTPDDGYRNWYAVLAWVNRHKPRIRSHRPVLHPSGALRERIAYRDGHFVPRRPDDVEAKNLIDLLGWERPEVFQERRKHVARIRDVLERGVTAREDIRRDPQQCSFATALEAELGLVLD